jgi:hypothetical protein
VSSSQENNIFAVFAELRNILSLQEQADMYKKMMNLCIDKQTAKEFKRLYWEYQTQYEQKWKKYVNSTPSTSSSK